MRWRWREQEATTSPEDEDESLALAETSHQEALSRLEESFYAREKAKEQKVTGSAIATALATIRAHNHFQEMWNEGLRGGK
jgi:hypothetical protein